MNIAWDVPIAADDAIALRAYVFGPGEAGRHPAIPGCGPGSRGLAFRRGSQGRMAVRS